jgi:DNA-directed RNA polymerase specialized sigma24 family protein
MLKINNEISEVLKNCDINSLIRRMQAFTISKLGYNKKNYDGIEPLDFVFAVFEKSLSGVRNWDKNKIDFEGFVFGSLKSDISASIEKQKRRKEIPNEEIIDESYILDLPVFSDEVGFEDTTIQKIDYKTQKLDFLEKLKDSEATDLEILIFECWCDEIFKPQEIADFLELDVAKIYNALKRLQKRRKNILQKKS